MLRNAGTTDAKLVTQDDASEATRNQLDVLDKAISQVDTLRGDLGAVQNRFILPSPTWVTPLTT